MAKTAEEILQEARSGKYIFSNNNKSKKSASDIKKNAEKYTVNVSDNYIKRFVTDSQQFLNNASREYSNVGYSGKDVAKKSVLAEKSDLDNRCNLIKAYYNANKNNIGKEPYTQMMSYLDSYDDSSNKVANAYIELASKGLKDFGTPYVEYVDEKELHKTQTLKGKTLSVPGATLNNPLKVSKNSSTFGELEAYKHISNYDAKTVTSKQIDDDIKRLESYKAGANRREKTENIDRYDAAINTLSRYRDVVSTDENYNKMVSEDTAKLESELSDLKTKVANNTDREKAVWLADYNDGDFAVEMSQMSDVQRQDYVKRANEYQQYFKEKYGFNNITKSDIPKISTKLDIYGYEKEITEKEKYLKNVKRVQASVELEQEAKNADDFTLYAFTNPTELYEFEDEAKYTSQELMTDSEKSVYNYYFNKYGSAKAIEYLDAIEKRLNDRAAKEEFEANLKGKIGKEIAFKFGTGVSDFFEGIDKKLHKKDYYIPTKQDFKATYVQQDLNDTSKIAGTAGDLATSVGNMFIPIITTAGLGSLGLGTTVSTILGGVMPSMIGVSASGNAYAEMINEGYSDNIAQNYALLVGGSEAGLQYLLGGISGSITSGGIASNISSKFSNSINNALLRVAVDYGANMVDEFTEESLQTILEPVFKSIATGEDYIPAELEDVLYSGLLGALSAGVFESGPVVTAGVQGVSNAINTNRQNKKYGANITGANNVNALVDSALSLPNTSENAEIIGLAKDIKSTGATKSSGLASNRFNKQVGKLYSLLQERNADLVFGAESIATKEAIREELVGLGVTESLDATVDAVYSELNGDKLSKKENALINTEQAQAVLKTIRNSSDVILNRAAEKQLEGIHNTYKTKRYLDNTNVEKSSDTEIDIEDYTQSDDGKTYIADTAQAVEVGDIKSVTKNDVVVELADGSTKSVKELSLGNKDSAVLYQGVVDIQNYMGVELSPYIANSIFNGYHESFGTAGEYISDVKSALAKGYISDNSKLTAYGLPQSVMQSYYDVGQALREAEVKKAKSKLNNSNYKTKSKVKFEGFDKSQLTARQQVGVAVVTYLADKLGYNVVFFESKRSAKTKSGFTSKYGEVNGQFDRDTNTMYIDVNAGMNGKGTILFTAAHELTHYFAKNSPEDFKAFSDFLVSEYIKHGVDVDELVKDRMQSQKLSYNEAFEEVIADSCERFLADGNLTQQVEKLSETNKSLAQKIKKLLSDLLAKVKEIYSRLSADSEESKIVSQMSDTLSDIMDKWSQGIINASKNADTVTGKSQTKNTANNDGVRYSLKAYSQHQIQNWSKSKNIVVYENEQQLRQFIDDARNGKNLSQKIYFGSIPESLAERIKQDTGLDVESYNCTLRAAEIRKIFSIHGNQESEYKRGQRAITEDDFVAIPQIIQDPDVIRLSNKLFEGKPVIEFVKTINGKTTVAAYVSKKHMDLTVQTMYSGKNKRNLATAAGVQAPANTPEAHVGTVPNNIISNSTEKSNSNSKKSSQRLIADTVEHFGTTYSWKETGYLLTDGRKLDFSGRKFGSNARYRTIDHREIWDGFSEEDQEQFESGSEAMVHFMQQGNIRIMPESDGINLSVAPTKAQESALSDYITRANGEILLDIDDLQGNTKVSVEYPSGTKTSKIINDIRQYFADGTEPYVSSIQEFRYSRRYTDIDLNTLDDNELKVYNNRGWASGLFTDEEHKLLQEKFNELNTRTRQKTDNVLGDGTRVVEVNNKLVLISGPFEAPIIHNVLVINANNETEAEIYKEIIYYEQEDHKRNKSEYSYGLQLSENIIGSQFVRNYESADFSYHKGRKDTGERALLPDSFKSYGYTKQFTERTGSNTETETYLSAYNQIGEKLYQTRPDFDGETKYQPRPSIDDFLFDDEYSELTDNDAYLIGQYITGDALTVNHLINNTRKTELSDSALNHIVSKLVKSYNLDSSNNKDISIALLSLLDSKNISDVKANMELISFTFEKVIKNTTFATEDDIALKEDLSEYLNDFRKENSVYLTDDQVSSLEFQGRSVGWLKNQLFGKLNVVKKNSDTKSHKVDFATFYYDLAQEFPQVFSAEDSDAVDNWETFLEKVDRIYHPQDAGVEYAFGKSQNNLAGELTGRLIADVVEKKYNNRKNGYVDTLVRKLHREHNLKVQKTRIETRRKVQEAEQKKRDKLVQKHEQQRKDLTERRNKTNLRNKIKNTIKQIDSYLNKGNKKKNVKEGVREFVSKALETADIIFNNDISNEDIIRRGIVGLSEKEQRYVDKYSEIIQARDIIEEKYVKAQEKGATYETLNRLETETERLNTKLKYLNQQLKDVFSREKAKIYAMPVKDALNALADAYSDTKGSKYSYISLAYDEDVMALIEKLKKKIGDGVRVSDMTLTQLSDVYDAFKAVLSTIRNANKLFKLSNDVSETSETVSKEMRDVKRSNSTQSDVLRFVEQFGINNLKPIYAFRLFGSKTFEELFWNLQAGESKWYENIRKSREFRSSVSEKFGYRTWSFDSRHKFKDAYGTEFDLSLEEMMSIYALSRRQQGREHLLRDGFVFDKNVEKKGDNKKVFKVFHTGDVAHGLSIEILEEIANTLTKEQRDYVEEMQKYLSTDMAQLGNEISMALYGIKLYKEKFYFPIKVSSDFLPTDYTKDEANTVLKNSGFSHKTVDRAGQPLVLSEFSQVWGQHCNSMAQYNAFVLPLEDITKVFNYKTSSSMLNEQASSVKQTLVARWGDSAKSYIETFIKDINGGVRVDNFTGVDKAISLSKKGAVFASLSVTIQQPFAIGRAMAYIDPKYFAKSTLKSLDIRKHTRDFEELKQYAPVAGIKEMGYFDVGIGSKTVDWILQDEYSGIKEKTTAFFVDKDYRDEVMSLAPAKADELAWVALWHAVKSEVKDTTNLSGEEYYVKCGERFNEIVQLTQVYDSVFSRSGFMRNRDPFSKMATAFMAEPTVTLNMAVDAVVQGNRIGGKIGAKYAMKTLGAVVATNVVTSLAKAIVVAGRDDDEDKTWTEKYISTAIKEVLGDINPLSWMPITRDLVSIMQGYDVERMDMSLFADLFTSLQKLTSTLTDDKTVTSKEILDVLSSFAAFGGIPLKNVIRDVKMVFDVFGINKEDKNSVQTAIENNDVSTVKNLANEKKQEKYDQYYSEGYTESDAQKKAVTATKSYLTKECKELYLQYLFVEKNANKANQIKRVLYSTGLWSKLADIDKLCQGWREGYLEEQERIKRAGSRK